MLPLRLLKLINKLSWFCKTNGYSLRDRFLKQTFFLPSFYRLSELLWQEGLLVDFLQKKVFDKWIRRHVILSSMLFGDTSLFRRVVDFYFFLITLPAHNNTVLSTVAPVFNFLYAIFLPFAIVLLVVLFSGWISYGLGLYVC